MVRDLSELSRGEGGLETEGGSQLFETAEKGGFMKSWPLKGDRGSPTEEKRSSLFCKKNPGRNRRVE